MEKMWLFILDQYITNQTNVTPKLEGKLHRN